MSAAKNDVQRNHNIIAESMYQSPDNILELGNKSDKVGVCCAAHGQEYDLYFELHQLLKRLLCWDGSQRPSAEECLESKFFKVGGFAPRGEKHAGILLQKPPHPPEQTDRSCESLSSCFQTDNLPAKPVLQPPSDGLLQSPLSPQLLMSAAADAPVRKGHRKTYSVDDRLLHRQATESSLSTRRHKHKRVDTEPASYLDRALLSSPLADPSPVGVPSTPLVVKETMTPLVVKETMTPLVVKETMTPLVMKEAMTPLLLTHHRAFDPSAGPVPPKTLTENDFRTPPPSLFQHVVTGRSPEMPAFVSSDGVSPNTPKPSFSIIHPPSFDDVSSTQMEASTEVASPQQIPLPLCSLFPNPVRGAEATALCEKHKRRVSFGGRTSGSFEVLSPRPWW